MNTAETQIGLVEDNPDDVYALRRAFSRLGSVTHWHSGEDLRADLVDDPALLDRLDLLIVDLGLPGVGGVDVVRACRSHPGAAGLPIVVLTGSAAEHDILRALDAGVTEYEVKPTSASDLQKVVSRCAAIVEGDGQRMP